MAKKKMVPGAVIKVQGTYISLNATTGIKTKSHYPLQTFHFPMIIKYREGSKKEEKVLSDGRVVSKTVPKMIKANITKHNVARHILLRYKMLEDRLKEKLPDFMGVHTCEVFSKEEKEIEYRDPDSLVINDMTASELNHFVINNDITVILSDYYELADKKIATQKAYDQKKKDEIAAKQSEETEEDELLDEGSQSALFG